MATIARRNVAASSEGQLATIEKVAASIKHLLKNYKLKFGILK